MKEYVEKRKFSFETNNATIYGQSCRHNHAKNRSSINHFRTIKTTGKKQKILVSKLIAILFIVRRKLQE